MKITRHSVAILLFAVLAGAVLALCICFYLIFPSHASVDESAGTSYPHAPSSGQSEEGIPYTTDSGCTFTYSTSTHFDLEIPKGGAFTTGREYWEEGDEIVFCLSSKETALLRVGIYPAEPQDKYPDYNSYGGFIGVEITAGPEVQVVSVTVPKSGEYGIGISHVPEEVELEALQTAALSGDVSMYQLSFDVNKPFLNHLSENYVPEDK